VVGSADVLVMDCRSRWWGLEQEGFGIVFVEAAATGIPQIAGRSGGSHEAVHDGVTGLIVNHPRRPRELALAIGDVVGDSDWRASAAVASRTSAVTEFSWDGLAARLSEGLDAFDGPLTYDEGDATHV
jgi:phosphatidylinositol alpha-1,6-mannosyltransferase